MEIALSQAHTGGRADTDLIRRMARGDEAALQELYAQYGRRLYAYALRLTGQPALAEEVLQDSLLAAWQGARRFRGESRLLTWLLGIVHHQACARLRRLHPSLPLDEAEPLLAPEGPEGHAEHADRARLLREGLQSLSRDHRAVLELVFYLGLSLAEVAQVCGCPVGTVKSRLSYGRAHLRRLLERAGLCAEDAL